MPQKAQQTIQQASSSDVSHEGEESPPPAVTTPLHSPNSPPKRAASPLHGDALSPSKKLTPSSPTIQAESSPTTQATASAFSSPTSSSLTAPVLQNTPSHQLSTLTVNSTPPPRPSTRTQLFKANEDYPPQAASSRSVIFLLFLLHLFLCV